MNTKTLGIIFAVTECVGVSVTGYLAARNAKKATIATINNIMEVSLELPAQNVRELEPGEYEEAEKKLKIKNLKTTLKCHIPTIIAGGLTCGLIIFSTSKHIKTEKNLLAAAMMSETLLEKYERQVRERTDPELAQQIREEVIGEVVSGQLDDIHECYSKDGAKMKIMEPCTQTIYYASQTELLLAEIELNKCLMNGGGLSLKDYIEMFDHERIKTHLVDPSTIGWYMDDCYEWEASYFGFHCALYSYWDKNNNYCVGYTHEPIAPSEDLY